MQKHCTGCSDKKSIKDFWKNKSQKDGLDNLCKECRKQSISQYRSHTKIHKEHKPLNQSEIEAKIKAQKERKKFNNISYWYGLSKNEYIEILEKQNYCCQICKEPKDLCVDHCHTSGKVRGLLCSSCNTGIGYLKERIELLYSAIEYLKVNKVE